MREVVDHRAMPGVMAKKKSPRRIVRGMKPSFWDNPFQGGDRNALVYVFTRRHAILLLRHLTVTGKWHSHFRLTWVTGVSSTRVAATVRRLERHGLIKARPRRKSCPHCPQGVRRQPDLEITEGGRALLFLVEELLHSMRRHVYSGGVVRLETWGPILGWIPSKVTIIGTPVTTEVTR